MICLGLIPVLLSDPNVMDCLDYLQKELKTGMAKVNYLTLVERFGEITKKSNKTALERNA